MKANDRMLPDLLFRGDSDPKHERQLHRTWNSGWLLTNLGSGGRGSDLFQAPLVSLIEKHVNGGWPKTHFLSFTSSRPVAEAFARGSSGKALDALPPHASTWDTAIMTFDTTSLLVEPSATAGFYRCTFTHRSRAKPLALPEAIALAIQDQARQSIVVPILLVDVLAALTAAGPNTVELEEARRKAQWDQEWIILPLEPIESGDGLTATLDDSCIVQREKFRLI